MATQSTSPSTASDITAPRQQAPTILIVDDEPINLQALTQFLQPDYRVRAANSGENALRAVAAEVPDLVLLDVMMPGMDGYEVLRQLRENPVTCDVPVIFLTVLSEADDEERGLSLGAADYIAKPIKPAVVLARVRNHIALSQAQAALRAQNAALEGRVQERTAALSRSLAQQQALNRSLEEAQSQLLQAEKMASLGQLAAGIAHELNNPIGFVHSNLGTLEDYLGDIFAITDAYEDARNDPARLVRVDAMKRESDFSFIRQDSAQLLSESLEGLTRVRKIVQDLKDFSHVGETVWQMADIHQCIDSTINIAWNELKYKCTLVKHYAKDLPQIRCLPAQLNQVFMNLLVNAAQAIEDKGEITIATEPLGAEQIRISVSDSGQGIPPESLKRIFEPFFTTKPVGKGTGLGLSIVWGIVSKHHGRIEVESTPGKGTTFTITLPVEQDGDTSADGAVSPC